MRFRRIRKSRRWRLSRRLAEGRERGREVGGEREEGRLGVGDEDEDDGEEEDRDSADEGVPLLTE